ncbi:hypothetical protein BDZ94DRAFT_1272645 [Collybia nuda]|uniref:BTB domain-containing protein n=1 Tax=Collybia nuda TaxID=64659 RepID=A0A9P5XVU7_9AGAR|nr:hypothetical protein BDZ94DRAFT_1272645 [Collybia nuda]
MGKKRDTPSEDVKPRVSCEISECLLPIDVILQSSDGVRFAAHSINLEIYSSAFPPAAFGPTPDEIVHLPESSEVIRLLLRYMHHHRQPDSEVITFDVLEGLAEAVEKYVIYSAMEVCKIKMKEAISDHPLEVLVYAAKHGYPDMCDKAAPATLSYSLEDIKKYLQHRIGIFIFMAKVQYRECWLELIDFAYKDPEVLPHCLHRGGIRECEKWVPFHHAVITEIRVDPSRMAGIKSLIESKKYLIECLQCNSRANYWASTLSTRITSVPNFSSFL